MTRPADQRWEVLGESEDPVPGDVYDLTALAKRFTATAKTISDTASALRRLGNLESWDSKAGRAFAEKANDTAKTVSKAHKRYEEAGAALKEYHTELETIQKEADGLLGQAETKSGDLTTAKSQADNPPEDTDTAGQKTLDTKVSGLQGDLDGLRGKLGALKTRHNKAGDTAAKRIHEVTESDDLNDSWLDDLRDTRRSSPMSQEPSRPSAGWWRSLSAGSRSSGRRLPVSWAPSRSSRPPSRSSAMCSSPSTATAPGETSP